jgi:hypothetical protein
MQEILLVPVQQGGSDGCDILAVLCVFFPQQMFSYAGCRDWQVLPQQTNVI